MIYSTANNEKALGVLRFTKEGELACPITVSVLDRLSARAVLSDEDQKIFEELRASLSEVGALPYVWTPQENHYIALNPEDRWLDYLIFRFKFRLYPKRKIVAKFPTYVLIEPASACNLRCPMCFQVDKTFTRKPFMGVMPLDLYRTVVDQLEEGGTKAVTMGSRGEPTMNKRLGEMLEYASDKFIELKLITNATFLTENLCHKILQSGVNIIVFSVDAHEKDLYEQIRVNGVFEEVLANIRRFQEIRSIQYPGSRIVTRVAGVQSRPDQDPEAFTAFWGEICDEVAMKEAYNRWDTYNNSPHPEFKDACTALWERIYIWYDGTVNTCDADYKSHLSPGNIRDQSVGMIWQGEAMKALREKHLAGIRWSVSPCDRCGIA